ncbi:efflux RND transporter periplasmic adaptor subunit [Tabrizicola sp.]|uniref:efflux RND transporter periplasmic adaptor subunit n=1 Tax=Tabrizicola sp. TaxID=2005166 RepID=UPI00286A5DA7|nr:efflux RND transporter periplasmic adaptor subunit [Tabrizicola sp.]
MRLIPFLTLTAALLAAVPAMQAVAEDAPIAPDATEVVLPSITVTEVTARTLRDRVIAAGLIGPVEEVQVQPLIEGQPLEKLLVEVGDLVTEGQVLAVLSNTTLELQRSESLASLASSKASIAQADAQLLEAEANAAEAQRVADRTKKLREQGTATQAAADTANANAVSANARVMVARQTLAAAKAQLDLSEAQLENVDLQLARTEVRAPVAGKIVERNARIGGIATASGQAMFVIVRDAALELRADIAESDLLRLKVGQKAVLHAAGTDAALTGTIWLVEPTIDATTRLGRARIAIDDPEMLRSGMFVEAEILVDERKAVSVPVTAVGSDQSGTTVMRVKDGLVERVEVKIGIRDGSFVEILEGLAEGDTVVSKAGAFVRSGDRINPVLDVAATN